jgi:hypothetical protein
MALLISDETMDTLLIIVTIASFLVGILVGGKWALVLYYKYNRSTRAIMVSGVIVAVLVLLLSQIPFFDLLFQILESLLGGGVAGVGVGLALYGYYLRTNNLEAINLVWNSLLFTPEERMALYEHSQKHKK